MPLLLQSKRRDKGVQHNGNLIVGNT